MPSHVLVMPRLCGVLAAGLATLALLLEPTAVRAHDGEIGILLDAQPAYDGSCWTRDAYVPTPAPPQFGRGGGPGARDGNALGGGIADSFPSNGVELLSWIPVTTFNSANTSASTVEGYVSPSGREYAIIGLSHGTGFVDVTVPGSANIVAFLSSSPAASSLWRDIRVYQNYCYAVSEAGGGIQVFNLSAIDSGFVTVVGNITSGGSAATHTVFVNQSSGYLYRCGGGSTLGLRIYSLTNPASPVFVVTALTGRYIHECQVVNYTSGPYAGREIAFCYSDATSSGGTPGLDILDVTNKASISALSFTTYPNARFSHQGWLSIDKQYVYLDDELDEQQVGLPTLTRVINVSNLSSPQFVTTFGNGGGAIDHNQYTKMVGGVNMIFQSNYRSGLRVWDATNQTAPVEIAYFDTYPPDDNPSFNGLWDNYPYLPSGIVLGSDIEKGLFVWQVGAAALSITFPSGQPALISPAGQNLLVGITNQSGALQQGSAKLYYSTNGGTSYASTDLTPSGGLPNTYNASFPPIACGTAISYYISAMTTTGMTVRSPAGAPGIAYNATAAVSMQVGFSDDMETNMGWVVGAPGDNATTGIWVRVDPVGTAAQPEDDHTPPPGVMCWVTGQGVVGGGIGDNDVDGGSTTLTSPTFDATQGAQARIEYYRWYSNNQGSAPNEDSMPVLISNNNGSTWTQLELVTENAGTWVGKSFRISDFVSPTNQMKLRFIARDLLNGSIVEAAVDDVRVTYLDCASHIPGDVDGNGFVNIDDLFWVINTWGACPPQPQACPADIAPPGPPQGNGFVNVDDLFMVINNWS